MTAHAPQVIDRDFWPDLDKEAPKELDERFVKKGAALLDVILLEYIETGHSYERKFLEKLWEEAFFSFLLICNCREQYQRYHYMVFGRHKFLG